MTFEQGRAQFLLDLADRAGDRGLGDVEMTPGGTQAASFGNREDIAQLAEFHCLLPPPLFRCG